MTAKFGPWVGVPENKQTICAVVDCIAPGKPHRCPYDGSFHHHGCIHYHDARTVPEGVTFREGWGLVCDHHYELLCAAPRDGR